MKTTTLFLALGLIVNTASLSMAAETIAITIDTEKPGHTISPYLFGDWIEWNYATEYLWDQDGDTGTVNPRFHELLKPLRIPLIRYPGGAQADIMHWQEATGPVAQRTKQPNAVNEIMAPVIFGPDEFAQTARVFGFDMLIVANVYSGTADEAAAWLKHYKSKGVAAKLWEIGNEPYLAGEDHKAKLSPEEYAKRFNQFAGALRAVDPDVAIGALGCHDSGPFKLCHHPQWDKVVLSKITERIDFLAVHNSYAPALGKEDEEITYKALMANADSVAGNLEILGRHITEYANDKSKDTKIAITEFAPFFLHADPKKLFKEAEKNRNFISALYSANLYNAYMRDPRVFIACHINMVQPVFQAHINVGMDWKSDPVKSIFYHVYMLYRKAGNCTYLASRIEGAPVYDCEAVTIIPAMQDVPVISNTAMMTEDEAGIYVYSINRDLRQDHHVKFTLAGASDLQRKKITAYTIAADDYSYVNTSGSKSNIQTVAEPVSGTGNTFSHTLPKHSLTHFVIE